MELYGDFSLIFSADFISFRSVSMAYFLGPLFGGEIAQYIGFSWLMSVIGCANIGYAFFLFVSVFGFVHFQVSVHWRDSSHTHNKCVPFFKQRNAAANENGDNMYLKLWPPTYSRQNSEYQRFYNTMDQQPHP